MATALDQLETAGGIAVPNFFNGRILSAEDLRMVMAADRRHRTLVGRALGPGVADGLRVSRASGSSLTVTAGVAVNRHGEVIDLPTPLEVKVAGSGATGTAPSPSGAAFSDCGGTSPTSSTSNAFLLTIRPDSIETGSAPADPYLTGASCGPGFLAEGVRFRRVPFDPAFLASVLADTVISGLGSASPRSRNVVAHLFLGSGPWTAYSDVAASGDPDPGIELAHQLLGLDRCEVPLAAFYLQGGSVAELDEWSVRRPCRSGVGDAGGLGSFTSELRAAAGTAAYLQFQAQLAELQSSAGPAGGARLAAHFRYLPAAGILPAACIGSPGTITDFLSSTPMPFFTGFSSTAWTKADRTVRSAKVEEIIRDGTRQPPIDLVTTRGLPLTVVAVNESMPRSEPYAVFVSAQHPYRDRIDLDGVIDRLAALEPPVDEDPFVTVAKQGEEREFREDGYVLKVNFRVVTNKTERFLLAPVVTKRAVSTQHQITATLDGPGVTALAEGATIVPVAFRVRYRFDTQRPVVLDVSRRGDRDDIVGVLFDPEISASTSSTSSTSSAAAADSGSDAIAIVPSDALGRVIEGRIDPVGGVVMMAQFTLGLDVSMVDEPTVSGRATFPYVVA